MVQYTILTESEKDTLALICRRLVELDVKTRRSGLLALESDLDNVVAELGWKNRKLVRKLLEFVIDGLDGNFIRSIADNYIASSCESSFEVLCFTLIKNGVCAIQEGDHPVVLIELLISYIGLGGEEDFRQRTGFSKEKWKF